jgi:enoyl-CoA hydratase/carnithine racemase
MYETIRVESRGESVARLVLARPPLNVLNIAMLKELCDAVDELTARPALRVLVIAAEGRAFSAE